MLKRDENLEDQFRHGQCYPMAFALAKRLGWRLEALVVDLPDERRSHLVHVWAVDHDGRPFDAGGFFERECLHEEFLATTCRKWKNDRIEPFETPDDYLDRLAQLGGGPDFWEWYSKKFFLPQLAAAEAAVEGYVVPRYLPDLENIAAPTFA